MKFFRKLKKGFTLVELVVVVAVIAILAAISVVSYTSITNKAKAAADSEIITQLNTQMRAKSIMEGKNETAYDAYLDAKEIGFDLELMKPQSRGNYVWDEEHDLFACVQLSKDEKSLEKVIAEDNSTKFSNIPERSWIFTSSIKEDAKYCQYLNSKDKDGNLIKVQEQINITCGFDAGENATVNQINYTLPDETESKNVIIRTNGGILKVNALKGEIRHYGIATNVKIEKISTSSFYEHGNTALVELTRGRLVITNDKNAKVENLFINKFNDDSYSEDLIVATMKGAKLPEVILRDYVPAPTDTNKKSIVTIQENVGSDGKNPSNEETIYIYGGNDVEKGTADGDGTYEDVSPLGQMMLEAPLDSEKPNCENYKITESNPSKAVTEEEKNAIINDLKGEFIRVTFKDTITITTLSEFSENWNLGKYFDLENPAHVEMLTNIDLTKRDYWGPIGCWEYPFFGTFDGHGFAINKLSNHATVQGENYEHVYTDNTTIGFGETYGFFGIVGGGDTVIKDLKFTNVDIDITNGKNVGTLIGFVANNDKFNDKTKWADNTTIGTDDLTVTNVVMESGFVTASSHVGGFVGKIYAAGTHTFENCVNKLTVTENAGGSGGLAGFVGYCSGVYGEHIIFRNCKNTSDAKLVFAPKTNVGTANVSLGDFVYINDPNNSETLKFEGDNQSDISIILPKEKFNKVCLSFEKPIVFDEYEIGNIINLRGNVTIKNSSINNVDNQNGSVTIESGTFGEVKNSGTIIIKGGSFKVDPGKHLTEDYISEKEGEVYLVKENIWVAEYNGQRYETLQAAVDAAKGNVIKLLKSQTIEKAITSDNCVQINLNGHNLTCAFALSGNNAVLRPSGKGTLTLTSGTKLIKLDLQSETNIIVNDGEIKRPDNGTAVQVQGAGTGTITIKGGTISGTLSKGNGNIAVEGGTFSNNPSDYVDTSKYNVVKSGSTWVVSAK